MTRLSRSLACLAIVTLLIAACGAAPGSSPNASGNPVPIPSAPASFALPSFALPSFVLPSIAIPSFAATGDVTVKLDPSGVDGLAAHYEAKPSNAACTVGLVGPELLYMVAVVRDSNAPTSYDGNWSVTLTTDIKAPTASNTQILFAFGDVQMSDPSKLPRLYSVGGGLGNVDVKVDDAGSAVTVRATGSAKTSLLPPDLNYTLEVGCSNVQRR
ncbi:MAG: hypothetical protein ABI628_08170 [Chloroflexota bacterium]